MLTERRLVGELMDDPAADRQDLERSLRFIRAVNRWLGGTRGALIHLRRWLRDWPAEREVRLIDLGAGSADIPLAIVRWAGKRGLSMRITAVDLHETTLELARAHLERHADEDERARIELLRADALRLTDHFEPGSFDFAHAGLFLHHLEDIEVLTVLRVMDRLAQRGMIWNDLLRNGVARVGVKAMVRLVPGLPEMVRHDAIVSVDAAFTRAEALDLARRAGLSQPRLRAHLGHRFTLTSENPVTVTEPIER